MEVNTAFSSDEKGLYTGFLYIFEKKRPGMISMDNTVLLVVDIQERLFIQMNDKEALIKGVKAVINGAKILNIPILVTEQAPQKIGKTISEIAGLILNKPLFEKVDFSCCGNVDFVKKIKSLKRKNIVIVGVETHVCVYQTAVDLIARGFKVHVVVDAVSSRTAFNKDIGLQLMKDAGASLTSVETVLCELLKRAQGEEFKEILKLIKY